MRVFKIACLAVVSASATSSEESLVRKQNHHHDGVHADGKVHKPRREVSGRQTDDPEGPVASLLESVRDRYLSTVRMGLLGGLAHGSVKDPTYTATTDEAMRGECLERDAKSKAALDTCIMKWDGNERLLRVQDIYAEIRKKGIPGDLMDVGVFRGGVSIYLATLMKSYGDSRKLWAADAFAHEEKKAEDAVEDDSDTQEDAAGASAAVLEKSAPEANDGSTAAAKKGLGWTSLAEQDALVKERVSQSLVEDNFRRFNVMSNQVNLVDGDLSSSLPQVIGKGATQLSFIHIDGDAMTTKLALDHLYTRVTPGGYIMIEGVANQDTEKVFDAFAHIKGLTADDIQKTRLTPESGANAKSKTVNSYFVIHKPASH